MFTARELSRRDPAMLALMGVAMAATDFGGESNEASGFAPEPRYADSGFATGRGFEPEIGWEATGAEGFFGADGGFFGGDVEGDFGSDFGAAAAAGALPKPTERQAIALWHHHGAKMAKASRRKSLLHPNAGIDSKIERYQLNVSQTFSIGTATVLNNLTKQPDTELRAQRILANVPVPVLVFYSEIKVANVSVTQGDAGDAFFLSPLAWGCQFDIPTLSPANRVTVLANSTTFVPAGFIPGNSFPLVFSFIGPASEVA